MTALFLPTGPLLQSFDRPVIACIPRDCKMKWSEPIFWCSLVPVTEILPEESGDGRKPTLEIVAPTTGEGNLLVEASAFRPPLTSFLVSITKEPTITCASWQKVLHCKFKGGGKKKKIQGFGNSTCTGPAAFNGPPTPPPTIRPSESDKHTLSPPVLEDAPPTSLCR